jgi:hypothetical protein
VVPGAHIVYVLDTAQLMTAWALSPDEKAQVLARFLAEDARQRLELRDQFEDIEGANVGRARLLPRARREATLRAFLFNLSDSVEDLLRHEREAMARATEQRRRSYHSVPTQDESAESRRGGPGDGRDPVGARACEALLQPGRWLISYLGVPLDTPPARLIDGRVKTTTPLHLRRARPDEFGSFDKRSSGRILPRDTTVGIEQLVPWNDTGFYFAAVNVLTDPS